MNLLDSVLYDIEGLEVEIRIEWQRLEAERRAKEYQRKLVIAADGISSMDLEPLVFDTEPSIRFWVARNPNLPAIFLDHLAKTETYIGTLLHVAANPNTHWDTLDWLARHSYGSVKSLVLENPNISDHTIEYLFGDYDLISKAQSIWLKRHPSTTGLYDVTQPVTPWNQPPSFTGIVNIIPTVSNSTDTSITKTYYIPTTGNDVIGKYAVDNNITKFYTSDDFGPLM